MKKIILLLFVIVLAACSEDKKSNAIPKVELDLLLDNWHKAAAQAQYDAYFNALAEDAVFLGTDATEHWSKREFEVYAKPYFDKGKAWHFTVLDRKWYSNKDASVVWFDELLNTSMKICRGSGVLTKNDNNEWKINQYVLSMTVPNEVVSEVITVKDSLESVLITQLQKQ